MTIPDTFTAEDFESYFERLWPLMRSITGEGVRETHDILGEILPLDRVEIPTGSKVGDWEVPNEWRFREAYVIGPDGQRRFDAAENNLRIVNYSVPFRGTLSRAELEDHLHSLPAYRDAIPYVTSYYNPHWGFCVTQEERESLPEGDYQIVVDTEMVPGSMTMSEAVLPGTSDTEVLFATYTCHPSLANNELSGPLVTAALYRLLARRKDRRLTYRFLFGPETLGAIFFLDRHGEALKENLAAGYVLTCVGDAGAYHYKRSRRGDSLADRAAEHFLAQPENDVAEILDFFPWGSDERQYCSPGYDLPVGSLTRTMYGRYPEYHTSHDDRRVIDFRAMVETVNAFGGLCDILESNRTYTRTDPRGEPRLDLHGLYPKISESRTNHDWLKAVRWALNMSDGSHDLISIAARSELDLDLIAKWAERCHEAGLLKIEDRQTSS